MCLGVINTLQNYDFFHELSNRIQKSLIICLKILLHFLYTMGNLSTTYCFYLSI